MCTNVGFVFGAGDFSGGRLGTPDLSCRGLGIRDLRGERLCSDSFIDVRLTSRNLSTARLYTSSGFSGMALGVDVSGGRLGTMDLSGGSLGTDSFIGGRLGTSNSSAGRKGTNGFSGGRLSTSGSSDGRSGTNLRGRRLGSSDHCGMSFGTDGFR